MIAQLFWRLWFWLRRVGCCIITVMLTPYWALMFFFLAGEGTLTAREEFSGFRKFLFDCYRQAWRGEIP